MHRGLFGVSAIAAAVAAATSATVFGAVVLSGVRRSIRLLLLDKKGAAIVLAFPFRSLPFQVFSGVEKTSKIRYYSLAAVRHRRRLSLFVV